MILNTSPARLLSKLESSEAEHAWRALLEQNPDCYDYYRGFLAIKGLSLGILTMFSRIGETPIVKSCMFHPDVTTEECRAAVLNILREFSNQIPRATAPRRLSLTVATGESFNETYTATGIFMLSLSRRRLCRAYQAIHTLRVEKRHPLTVL